MKRIDQLTEVHTALKAELTRLDGELSRISPAAHIRDLECIVDDAASGGNQNAIDDAVAALTAARAGTDEIGQARTRLESQRRVTAARLDETSRAIEETKKAEVEQRSNIAGDLLGEVRDEYERHARALLALYPRLYARAMFANQIKFASGRRTNSPPVFPSAYACILPMAGGVGLPPELCGNPSYHAEEYRAEMEAVSAMLEQRFEDQRQRIQESDAAA